MKTIAVIFSVVFIGILATLGFAYSGIYDVSASSPHGDFVKWLLSTTSHASVERHAKGIEVPDLDNDALVLAGANDFDSMCAGCHGAPGRDPEAMGKGLNPRAPDLAEEAAEMTPAELFWVTKNGIRMTGMPAWGVTHDDEAIWPVVAFMTKLPDLDESAYQDILNAAVGRGHHSDDSASEEHSHVESDDPSDDEIHVHEDGSEHDHGEPTESAVPAEHDHSTHEHNDD